MTAIEILENKGYRVEAEENMWMGELDKDCPIVYAIVKPDGTEVYGANGVSLEGLNNWLDLADLTVTKKSVQTEKFDPEKEAVRKIKEREYDAIYNEGSEGYNPYR